MRPRLIGRAAIIARQLPAGWIIRRRTIKLAREEERSMANSPIPVELEAARSASREWPRRYTVVLLFALATALCYIDRVNISIAVIPLARAKGYDPAAKGLVLSAFFWGYLWLQMPGGWVADRFGGKKILMAGVALWSLAAFFTPLSASLSFGALLLMRALLGAGGGGK